MILCDITNVNKYIINKYYHIILLKYLIIPNKMKLSMLCFNKFILFIS